MCFQVIILFSLLLSCLRVKLDFLFNCKYGLPAKVIKHYILNSRPIHLAFSEFNLHTKVSTNAHWRVAPFLNLCHRGELEQFLNLPASDSIRGDFQLMEATALLFLDCWSFLSCGLQRQRESCRGRKSNFTLEVHAAVSSDATSNFRELNCSRHLWLISRCANITLHVSLQ